MQIKRVLKENEKHSNKYPYICVREMGAVFILVPVPNVDEKRLLPSVVIYAQRINRRVCLVMSPSKAFYVEPGGLINLSNKIPSGGTILG